MTGILDLKTVCICSEGLSFIFGAALIAAEARHKNRRPGDVYYMTGLLLAEMGTAGVLYGLLALGAIDNPYTVFAETKVLPGLMFLGSGLLFSQYFPGMIRGQIMTWRKILWMSAALLFPAAAIFVRVLVPQLHLVGTGFILMYYFIYIYYQSSVEMELLKKQMELSESRMVLLTRQISPHFFFNMLNAMQELCRRKPEVVEEALGSFSEYMQMTIEALTKAEMVPFSSVLQSLEDYLELEEVTGWVRPETEFKIEVSDFMVPPYLVEPVVGSALWRIRNSSDRKGKIVIGTEENNYRYIIRVTDIAREMDIRTDKREAGYHPEEGEVEIDRARARLSVMCGGEMIITKTADRTEAAIIIPKEKSEIHD